jgi:EF-P beta-lysylation protein EpmB
MILTTASEAVRPKSAPESLQNGSVPRWQQAMRQAVRSGRELCRLLNLPAELACPQAEADFPVFVPPAYLARIRPGDLHDPLLLQILPQATETESTKGFTDDPLAEMTAQSAPGMLHKYAGRVLLVTTGTCAIHCRYCFRRHFPYQQLPSLADWQPALDQISADNTVEEVILSGGDPLTLADGSLRRLVEELAAIQHVRRLRIHTRLPVMIPERVTDELLATLRGTRLVPIVVLHANCAQELDEAVAQAVARLVDAGVPMLNQAVLLKGVNDTTDALVELSRRLLDLRVLPYYLHQLDRVRGAAHFEVPKGVGLQLIETLRQQMPGYAVPRYVEELAGETSKREIIAP